MPHQVAHAPLAETRLVPPAPHEPDRGEVPVRRVVERPPRVLHVKSMTVMMARMSLTMHTAAERADLWERGIPSESVWPEYNLHGDVLNRWWGHLDEDLPDYQFVLYDEATDEVVAEGHTGPMWWDGHDETLPHGIDPALEQIFERARAANPSTRCAHSPRRVRVPAATAVSPCSCCRGCARSRSGRGSATSWHPCVPRSRSTTR